MYKKDTNLRFRQTSFGMVAQRKELRERVKAQRGFRVLLELGSGIWLWERNGELMLHFSGKFYGIAVHVAPLFTRHVLLLLSKKYIFVVFVYNYILFKLWILAFWFINSIFWIFEFLPVEACAFIYIDHDHLVFFNIFF